MSLLHLMIITAIVAVLTIVFNIALHIANKKPKDESAENIGMTAKILRSIFRNQTPLKVLIMQSITCLLCGALLISTGVIMGKYKTFGALYEDEINLPIKTVISYFEFEDESTLLKDAIANRANPDDLDIIIVRFGCKDCSNHRDELLSIQAQNNAYIIFSRSDIGKEMVEKYNITAVPAYIDNGTVIYYN